MNWS